MGSRGASASFLYVRLRRAILRAMKKVLPLLGVAVGTLLLFVLGLYGYGTLVPRKHVAEVRATFEAPRSDVWNAIYPPDDYPEWMPNVTGYEKVADVAGKPAYKETNEYGEITYVFDVRKPGEQLVVEVGDTNLGFEGRWTYRLEEADGKTVVTIIEEGAVESPLMRAIGSVAYSPDETARIFLGALGDHLGAPAKRLETVRIE